MSTSPSEDTHKISLWNHPSVNPIVNKPKASDQLRALKYEQVAKDHHVSEGKPVAKKRKNKTKELGGRQLGEIETSRQNNALVNHN